MMQDRSQEASGISGLVDNDSDRKHHHGLSRRKFLKVAGMGAAGVFLFGAGRLKAASDGIAGLYAGLDSEKYLGAVRTEVRVTGPEVFLEGPAVNRAGEVFFTNTSLPRILKWAPQQQSLTVFRYHSHHANGLLFDPEGRLLACEGDGRITRTDMRTGAVEVLADGYRGHPLEAPNDLALDSKGRIYFSSRPGGSVPSKGYVNAVYRIDPDGSIHQILRAPEVQMPNGLVVSPDDRTFYLIEAHSGEGHYRHITAYDLGEDGTVSNPRILIDFYPGRSGDGMCIDREGNLYVGAGLHHLRGTSETLDTKPGVHVISPSGELLAYAETPMDTITNCTFGGKDLRTLYAVCGDVLVSMHTGIPGDPRYRPER